MVRGRGLVLATAVIVGATTVLYVALIVSQGEVEVGRVAFVVLLLLTALACVIATLTIDNVAARGVAGFAAAGLLLSMGYLALFSVGLPLMVAGVLMVAWLVRTSAQRRGSGWLAPVAACAIGAALPWALILFP
jgi:hypothetical protein